MRYRRPAQKFYIITYNIKTISTEEHLQQLQRELENIKWDIIGLCEENLSGEKITSLKAGQILYQNNSNTTINRNPNK